MKAVEIYESLFQYEKGRDAQKEGYPIHKRLVFNDSNVEDIYDWILVNFRFAMEDRVLDAGCGVGYGSMKLAKSNSLLVTGISISPSEIEKANSNANHSSFRSNLDFVTSSFEDAPDKQYNFIIAVESLKHSLDLNKSLKSLHSKLAPNGTMIIVEDFYQSETINSYGKTLMKDWALVDLFRIEDFSKVLTNGAYHDLTSRMPDKNSLMLKLRNLTLSVLSLLPFSDKKDVFRIFRGGILLDLLFSEKKMKYGVYVYKKSK